MIRALILVCLLCGFSLSMVSCSSAGTSSDAEADDIGPIEDEDVAAAESDAASSNEQSDGAEASEDAEVANEEKANEDVAANEQLSEEELESEFEDEPQPEENQKAQVTPDEEVDPLEEKEGDVAEEPVPVTPALPAEPVPAPVAPARIRDIRFVANSKGGTVVIESNVPVTYQTRMNAATQQFVVEIADVELPASLQKPFQVRNGSSAIGSINAYQSEGSKTARIVVQMQGSGASEPIVQQEENALVVIPPAPVAIAKAKPEVPVTEGRLDKSEGNEGPLQARTLDEFLTGNQKFYGRLISFQAKDADVRDVINFLAEESGSNIVMSDDISGKISIKLRRVPWDQALVTVMRSKSFGYLRQGNVLRISKLESLQKESEATAKIIEAQNAIVPEIVQVIPVSYADLTELTKNLTPFLSKKGSIVADNRTSTVVVTDKAETVERVKKLVKTFDVPPYQVSIESKIVEAVEQFDRFIGVNWNFGGTELVLSDRGGADGAPISLSANASSGRLDSAFQGSQPFIGGLNIGTLDFFGDLTAALTLAERDQLAKVISAPRISTMNREKSIIRQEGENVSIISQFIQQTQAIARSAVRTPFSLELTVTPQVTNDGGVIIDLEVRREFLGPVVDEEIQAQAINKRFAKTKLLVRSGQTAVIGGIYTSDETERETGIPGLRGIPVLGWLFKNKSYSRSKNELLIFLTPRVLNQDDLGSSKTASIQEEE